MKKQNALDLIATLDSRTTHAAPLLRRLVNGEKVSEEEIEIGLESTLEGVKPILNSIAKGEPVKQDINALDSIAAPLVPLLLALASGLES